MEEQSPEVHSVVVDPAGGRVVARVWVRGTADTAITTADGAFELPYSSAGKFMLLASDSLLASLGISRTVPSPVQLDKPGNWDVWLTFHPRSAVLPYVCPAKSYKPGTRCVDGDGEQCERNSRLRSAGRSRDAAGDRRRGYSDATAKERGSAGDDGRFVICGAALNQQLLIRAIKGDESAVALIDQWKDEVIATTSSSNLDSRDHYYLVFLRGTSVFSSAGM